MQLNAEVYSEPTDLDTVGRNIKASIDHVVGIMAHTKEYEHKEKIQANNKVELAPYMKAYNFKYDDTMEIDIVVTWNVSLLGPQLQVRALLLN